MPIHQHNKFCYLDFQLILPGYATRSESRTYKTQHQPSPVTCHLKQSPVFSHSFRPRMASPSGSRSSSPCPSRLSHHRPQTGKTNSLGSMHFQGSYQGGSLQICKDITFTFRVSLPSALQNMNPSQRCR